MCVLACESTKTGSICRTKLLAAVVVGSETVAVSSDGPFGSSGVARTTCSKACAPSAHSRIVQSALPVGPHAPQEAHHLTVIWPPSVVGLSTYQIQLGS